MMRRRKFGSLAVAAVLLLCALTGAFFALAEGEDGDALARAGSLVVDGTFDKSTAGESDGAWGINNGVGTIVETDGNRYDKRTGGGWVTTRVWNADFMAGKLYRLSADLKVDDASGNAQFLLQVDPAFNTANGDWGSAGLMDNCYAFTDAFQNQLADWTTCAVYFRIELDRKAQKGTVLAGVTPTALAEKGTIDLNDAAKIGFVDFKIGTGSMQGNWYVDNVAVFEVYDGEVTVEGTDAYGLPIGSAELILENVAGTRAAAPVVFDGNRYLLKDLYGKQTVAVKAGTAEGTCALSADAPKATVDLGATDFLPAENLIDNGDFEALEAGDLTDAWGIDNGTLTVVEENGNKFTRKTDGGWLNYRVWQANFMSGKTYCLAVDLKAAAGGEGANAQFLLQVNPAFNNAADAAAGGWAGAGALSDCYVCDSWQKDLAEWTTVKTYVRIEVDYEAQEAVVLAGATPETLVEKGKLNLTDAERLGYVDLKVGTGSMQGDWYVDNVVLREVGGRRYEQTLEAADDLYGNTGTMEGAALGAVANNYLILAPKLHVVAGTLEVTDRQSAGGLQSLRASGGTSFRLRQCGAVTIGKEYYFSAKLMQNAVNALDVFLFAQAHDKYLVNEADGWRKTKLDRGIWQEFSYRFSIVEDGGKLVFYVDGEKLCDVVNADVTQEDLSTYFDLFVQIGENQPVYLDDARMFEVFEGRVSALNGEDAPYETEELTLKLTDAFGKVTELGAADYADGVFTVSGLFSAVRAELFVDGVSQGAKTLSAGNSAIAFSAPYVGTVTVVGDDGELLDNAVVTVVSGSCGTITAEGNVFTVDAAEGDVVLKIKCSLYLEQTVTLTRDQKAQTVTLTARELTPSPADYTDEIVGAAGFETAKQGDPSLLNVGNTVMFQNGGGKLTLTDEVSHWGAKSAEVNTTGDRLTLRLADNKQVKAGIRYTAVFYVRAKSGTVTLRPCVVCHYYNVGDPELAEQHGANNFSATITLGEFVSVGEEWQRVEIEFRYEIKDGKIFVESPKGTEEVFTAGKTVHSLSLFDLSFNYEKTTDSNIYYADDAAIFEQYTAGVTVLEDGEPTTENVVLSLTDYTGETREVTPTVEDGVFRLAGLFGKNTVTARLGTAEPFAPAKVSKEYADVLIGDPYTATAAVFDQFGARVDFDDVLAVFAMDGATRIDGVYDDKTLQWSFPGAMGDVQIYAYVRGSEQHKYVIATRKSTDVKYLTSRIPDASTGLAGNIARNGNVEELSQLRQWENVAVTYPGVSTEMGEGNWSSFGAVVSLSDEAAVGQKSLRISRDPSKLADIDAVYKTFLDAQIAAGEYDPAVTGNNRVAFRAGNAFGVNGAKYVMTNYLKAPKGESVTFDYIFLQGINLCNNGAMNVWCTPTVTVGGDFWSKLVTEFSMETVLDDGVPAGTYEYDRYKLVWTLKISLNDKVLVDGGFEYGYAQYKDGSPNDLRFDGQSVSWTTVDTEKHDGTVKVQEGGRSFGSLARFEPSFMIANSSGGDHLLVDGTTIVEGYDAVVTVLNRDTTANDEVGYFRVVDMWDNVALLEAGPLYDKINKAYYLPGLVGGCTVEALDADRQPLEGLKKGELSADKTQLTLEPEYNATITLKDTDGKAIAGIEIYVTLDTGAKLEFTDNGDGTYSVTGLTGVRTLTMRNKKGAVVKYTFPAGKTVSSKNNVVTIEITEVKEGGDEPKPGPKPDDGGCGGCGSCGGAAVSVLGALLLAGAAACKRLF